MRKVAIGCIVLLTLAATAFSEETEQTRKEIAVDLGAGVNLKMVLVPPGEFMMGSGESAEATAAFFNKTFGSDLLKADSFKNEHPQHRVRITKPFYLGTYHVTRGQFRQFVTDTSYKTDAEKGEKPGGWGWNRDKKQFGFNERFSWRDAGFEQTDEHPVVCVSWNDAVAFCAWLSKKEGKAFRLPTEAEWEYACRARAARQYDSVVDPATIARAVSVADATAEMRHPSASRATAKAFDIDEQVFTFPVGLWPNEFWLYDMHGNAWQWCSDRYGEDYYAKSPVDDPTGPNSGDGRVLRGGSWFYKPFITRSAIRSRRAPNDPGFLTGFRVARDQ